MTASRQRAETFDARKGMFDHLRRINAETMQGCIYVIEFSSGTVKVGLAKNWDRRLSQHAKEARNHGILITRSWVSPLHVGWAANEQALIARCVASFGEATSGNEYFAGADFDIAVSHAESLPFVLLTDEALDAATHEAIAREDERRALRRGIPASEAGHAVPPSGASLLASLSEEQLADIRRQRDRKEWADRVRLRREIRAWELSDQGREWAAQYGFTTNPDLRVAAGGTR